MRSFFIWRENTRSLPLQGKVAAQQPDEVKMTKFDQIFTEVLKNKNFKHRLTTLRKYTIIIKIV